MQGKSAKVTSSVVPYNIVFLPGSVLCATCIKWLCVRTLCNGGSTNTLLY